MSHTRDLQNAEPYIGLAILSQTCEPYEGLEVLRQLCVAKLSQPCEPYEGLAKLSQTCEPHAGLAKLGQTQEPYAKLSQTREPYERVTESNSTLDRRKTLGCSTFDKTHNEIKLSNPHPQTDAVPVVDHHAETPRQTRTSCASRCDQPR